MVLDSLARRAFGCTSARPGGRRARRVPDTPQAADRDRRGFPFARGRGMVPVAHGVPGVL